MVYQKWPLCVPFKITRMLELRSQVQGKPSNELTIAEDMMKTKFLKFTLLEMRRIKS